MAPSNRKYAAFDLETAAEIPDGSEWREHRPLGITCAALYTPETDSPVTWYSTTQSGEIADLMSREDLKLMVHELAAMQEQRGFTIVTWNGLGFDFDVLAEESGQLEECRRLTLDHVDMMFHILCKQGYPLSLQAAALGMKLEGKTAGMDGEKAVEMWRDGQREDVVDYCAQDSRCTLELALASEKAGSLRWTSRSGRDQSMAIRAGWLTVRQAMKLPQPDTGWMTEPLPREIFTQWLTENTTGESPPSP